MNSISIIGTGYVGLVTGTCLSEFGLQVICMDSDAQKIQDLGKDKIPIYEPGLPALISKNVASGRLRFTTDISEAVSASTVIFIAVHTPPSEDGSADLQHVLSAAESIALHMNDYKVVVNKSTVPIGTGRKVQKTIHQTLQRRGLALDFDVVSNPEFLREGSAIRDFMHPDRVVIGSDNEKSREIIRDIYNVLYLIDTPFIFTSIETAELVKYASNAFLATKIAFINEVANLCDVAGADVRDIAKAMGLDGRIGRYFLHPGPGFGGSCLPKDTKALAKIGQELGTPMRIVESVISANNHQRQHMVNKIEVRLPDLKDKVIGVLGLAFKQGTDDIRESAAIQVVFKLMEKGACVRVYDPFAMDNAKKHAFAGLAGVESKDYNMSRQVVSEARDCQVVYCLDEYDAAKGADGVVILTEWNQFRHMDLAKIASLMRGNFFFDFRNIYEPGDITKFNLVYEGIGRSKR
jgi:UDPglucose 6-dehydrogenase